MNKCMVIFSHKDDQLQVVVDCHFTLKPTGNEYWDDRQWVSEAIHLAAEKTGIQFKSGLVNCPA